MQLDNKTDTGNQWIFGLVFIFLLVIVSIIIIPVVDDFVKPALIGASTLEGAEQLQYISQVNFIMFAIKLTPFILSVVVMIYLGLSVFRREREENYIV
jgi:hypothetical protein